VEVTGQVADAFRQSDHNKRNWCLAFKNVTYLIGTEVLRRSEYAKRRRIPSCSLLSHLALLTAGGPRNRNEAQAVVPARVLVFPMI